MKREDGPVYVRAFKQSRKDETVLQVEFAQKVLRPITDSGAALNVFMSGHPSFGSPFQTRVAYQTMSVDAFKNFGLGQNAEFPTDWKPRLVVHEFCEGDVIPESVKNSFPTVYKTDTYVPRHWIENVQGQDVQATEKPKMTPPIPGQEQQTLCRDGQPIYRNVYFAVEGMDQNDYTVRHTNNVTGSTNDVRTSSTETVGSAEMPS
jgi:hypothetical protein